MAMNPKERAYIEYRPNYGYQVNILAIIEALGTDPNKSTHVFPVELQEALENPAGPVFRESLKLLDSFDAFMDELETKLANDIGGGIPFTDYLQARKDGHYDITDAYENYHRTSMDGKLEAELYPILSHTRENLASMTKFLNEQAFMPGTTADTTPGSGFRGEGSMTKEQQAQQDAQEKGATDIFNHSQNVSSDLNYNPKDYGYTASPVANKKPAAQVTLPAVDTSWKDALTEHYDNPDVMLLKEQAELEALARLDIEHGLPSRELTRLKTKTEIVRAIEDGLEAKKDLLQGAKILTRQSVDEAFGLSSGTDLADGENPYEGNENLSVSSDDTEAGNPPAEESDKEVSTPEEIPTVDMPGYDSMSGARTDGTSSSLGVQNVIEGLAEASEAAISSSGKMLSIVHAAKAAEMEDLGERQAKLYGISTLEIVQEEIEKLRELVIEAEELVSWMEEADTNFDQSALTDVIMQNVAGVHMTLEGYESALLDLHKLNNMERMHGEDVINTAADKDLSRKTYGVIKQMKTNYSSMSPNAAKAFVQNMGLNKSEVVRPKEKSRTNGSLNRDERQ